MTTNHVLDIAYNILMHTDLVSSVVPENLEDYCKSIEMCNHKWGDGMKFVNNESGGFEYTYVKRCQICKIIRDDYEMWIKPLEETK